MSNEPKPQLVHHDLISVPLGERDAGIYWLRLYESSVGSYIATVTEVPGNPGRSVTNAISDFVAWVSNRFRIAGGLLRLYQIWPRGAFDLARASVKRITFEEGPAWIAASRGEIGGPTSKAETPR